MTEIGSLDVSRETLKKLETFSALVEKWTRKINLISKHSLPNVWKRHIIDSAQIFDLAPPTGRWVDLGSGGGFPGIVIAVMAQGAKQNREIILVESDLRKATFLRTAARELELNIQVIADRIEVIEPLNAQTLTARALADLETLCTFAERHLASDGIALFPKGQQWQKEDAIARKQWSYRCEAFTSKTSANAAILKIEDVARV